MFVTFATRAEAQQNPFEIDGVVDTVQNSGVSGVTVVTDPDEPSGTSKELGPVNSSLTKVGVVHSAATPMLGETAVNGSTDLNTIFTQSRQGDDGYQWFYFGWIKDSGTGSGFVSLEFQQRELNEEGQPICDYSAIDTDPQSVIANCNPWRNRSAGDVLLLWDFSGSAQTLIKRTFAEDPNTGQVILPPCPQGFPAVEDANCEQIDGADFIATFGASSNPSRPDRSRGEAAINLTNVLFGGLETVTCRNFANVIPNTVTGNSDSADYKDTVLFDFEDISNCGKVTVTKVVVPFSEAIAADEFTYTLANGGLAIFNGSGLPDDCDSGDATQCVGTVKHFQVAADIDEITNVLAGTGFTLTETPNPLYSTRIVCTLDGVQYVSPDPDIVQSAFPFPVEALKTTACVITNTRKQGTLTVIKIVNNTNGGQEGPGAFLIDLGDETTTPFAGSAAGTTSTFDAGHTFSVSEASSLLTSGQYTMQSMKLYRRLSDASLELITDGSCDGTIMADVDLVCEIVNVDIAATLTIIKQVINDNGGLKVASEFTLTIGGVTADGGNSVTGAAAPGVMKTLTSIGVYSVTENDALGYDVTYSEECNGTIALGESKTCTVTNNDVKASPGIGTLMSWQLQDSATITGLLPGADNPGNIVFRLYKGSSCVPAALVHTELPIAVTASGTYSTSVGFGVVQGGLGNGPGEYRWVASYSGDEYNDAVSNTCGDETHTIVIGTVTQ